MTNLGDSLRRAASALVLIAAAASVCAAQRLPSVTKVEPPSWWAGHTVNPVRLLLRGQNLAGARVEALGQGLRTGLVRVNEAGTYAFVDLFIERDARPGARMLRVTTAAGTAD